MEYNYELVLVDHWSDEIARWFIGSKLEPHMMHELIDLYNEEVKEKTNSQAFLCVTLIETQEMPSLERIIKAAKSVL